jgi:hypothetical protein
MVLGRDRIESKFLGAKRQLPTSSRSLANRDHLLGRDGATVEELTIEILEAEGFVKLGAGMAIAGSTRERDCMAANALWWRMLNSELGRDEVPFDRRSAQRADVAVAACRR